MGEGKTSVILPLVCAIVSNGERVSRVNVIPSLLDTNVSFLFFILYNLCYYTNSYLIPLDI